MNGPSHHNLRRPKIAWFFALIFGVAASFLLSSEVALAQTCVDDVSGLANLCTAHDVNVVGVDLLGGSDTLCSSENDTINVTLRVRLRSNATRRYDIGIFAAQDGGDAFTGQCARSYFTPATTTPFYDADGDLCGDLASRSIASHIVGPVTVACQDNDGDGFVDVSTVVTWDNNARNLCRGIQDLAPSTRSKCSANGNVNIPVPVHPPKLELAKFADAFLVNAGEQVGFTIALSNTVPNTLAENVLLTDTLPAGFTWRVEPGSDGVCTIFNSVGLMTCEFGDIGPSTNPLQIVRIVADSTVDNCGPVPNVAVTSYEFGGTTVTDQAEATMAVACSRVIVDKVTIPPGSETPFGYEIGVDGTVLASFTLTDTQEPFILDNLTPTLTYNVDELPVDGWQQTASYCDDPSQQGELRARSALLDLAVGVNCVFTNTQLATVKVIKTTDGGDGLFNFTLTDQPNQVVSAAVGTPGQAEWTDLQPDRPYTLTETLLPSWQEGTFSCTSTSASGTTNFGGPATGVTFTPEPGASIECSIENVKLGKIVVTKQSIGDPTQLFTFTTNYDEPFALANGLQYTSPLLPPGTYSVQETSVPGWALQSGECSGGYLPNNIALSAGEVVTCIFVNVQYATVTVTKSVTSTTGASGVFTFTSSLVPSGQFTLAAGTTPGQTTFDSVLPGTYTLAEDAAPGWTLESVLCREANTGTLATGLPQLDVEPGQNWQCEFVNRFLEPEITFEKSVTTTDDLLCAAADTSQVVLDGASVIYCFKLTNSGNVTLNSPYLLSDLQLGLTNVSMGSQDLPVGASLLYTHTVLADTMTNTAVVSVTTPTGVLTATDVARVDIADLVIDKLIGPAGGPFVDATPSSPFLADVDQSLEWRWYITNTGTAELDLTVDDLLDGQVYTLDCQVPASLLGGQSFTCTSNPFPAQLGLHINSVAVRGCTAVAEPDCIDLTDEEAYVTRPLLTVTKVVQNDWNGQLQPGDFTLTVSGTTQSLSVSSGVSESLDAGFYQVMESVEPGYAFASFGGDCSSTGTVTLDNGQAYECTLLNQDLPAKLNLIKIVEATPPYTQSFTLTVNALPVGSVKGPQAALPTLELAAGAYTIGEVTPPADYTTAIGGDCASDGSLNLANGMTYTCVITNTRAGRIHIVKQTLPRNSTQQFSFTPSYGPPFTLVDGDAHESPLLPAGQYSVAEASQTGWRPLAALCTNGQTPDAIDLQNGETVTCTFINRQLGQIIVEKQTNPAGADLAFEFRSNFAPDFALRDGERFTSTYLLSSIVNGAYNVQEVTPQGWRNTAAVCDDGSRPDAINLGIGEVVTCTFTNDQEASVGDRAWNDVIVDGIQDDPLLEPGVPGIIVSLLDVTGNIVAFKVTNSDGNYRIDAIPFGTYALQFRDPRRRFDFTIPNAGTDNTRDSDVVIIDQLDPSIGKTENFTLPPGAYDPTWDAGLIQLEIANSAAIGGVAWNDENKNGLRDPGEELLSDIPVELYGMPLGAQAIDQGTLLATMITGADGSFLFTGLSANRYMLRFDMSLKLTPTLQSVGSDNTINSDIDAAGVTDIFFVPPNSTDTRRDAGFIVAPTNLDPGEQPTAPGSYRLWVPVLEQGQ